MDYRWVIAQRHIGMAVGDVQLRTYMKHRPRGGFLIAVRLGLRARHAGCGMCWHPFAHNLFGGGCNLCT